MKSSRTLLDVANVQIWVPSFEGSGGTFTTFDDANTGVPLFELNVSLSLSLSLLIQNSLVLSSSSSSKILSLSLSLSAIK